MKDRISELMDGELDDRGAAQTIDAIGRDAEACEAWRTYHLISDAMRDTPLLSEGFTSRLSSRLAGEPTALAPAPLPREPRRWFPMALAAGSAVALVGWLAFVPQQPGTVSVAEPVAKVQTDERDRLAVRSPAAPIPVSANDYLLAHQGFAPRMILPGMVPYVRTVAGEGSRK